MDQNQKTTGIGSIILITILLSALKLLGLIDTEWFWVLSPVIFVAGMFIMLFILILIARLFCHEKDRQEKNKTSKGL